MTGDSIKYCELCFREIYSKNPKTKYCTVCRNTRQSEIRRIRIEKRNSILNKENPLYEDMVELERYNKEHGTNLSYGKYKALLYLEKEKGRK